MTTKTLGALVYGFFEDHLKRQKGLQTASIKNYRDAIRLFLCFVAQYERRPLSRLRLEDLTANRVSRFLSLLETERHNHIRSRNQRLSALRGFFDYLACQVPEQLMEAEQVAALPSKRVAPPETLYLERDEIEALFANLPSGGRFALRDRALLLVLYNTGARVQEMAELRVAHLKLFDPPCVHLHGKGDKWRACPLWPETVALVRQLLAEQGHADQPEQPVFTSQRGEALTRFGIYKLVRRHTRHLVKAGADAKPRPISPHVVRHTTAVHLLESGVDVNVIRAWLGHVSLETTNRYAEITLRMKAEALEICEPPLSAKGGFPKKPVWRDDESLLNWLKSL